MRQEAQHRHQQGIATGLLISRHSQSYNHECNEMEMTKQGNEEFYAKSCKAVGSEGGGGGCWRGTHAMLILVRCNQAGSLFVQHPGCNLDSTFTFRLIDEQISHSS